MIRSDSPGHLLAGAVLAACLSAAPGPASAASKGGVTMPDTMQVDGHPLVLNGIGIRSFTILHIRGYVAALYLTRKAADVQSVLAEPAPKVLTIQYTHSGTVAQLTRLYTDSSHTYCARHACTDADKTAFETLLNAIRPVQPGDQSSFVITDHGVQELLDGRTVVTVPDPAFGNVIIDSDIGTTAPSAELRDGLLGVTDD